MSENFSPFRKSRLLVALLIVLTISGVSYLLYCNFAGPNLARYDAPLHQYDMGTFQVTTGGHIDLTALFPGLTPRNDMFVSRRPDGSFLAMFPLHYGDGSNMNGLLYTSRPMRDTDTQITILASTLSRRTIDVGTWTHLWIETRLNEHWYRVSRDY